MANHTSEIITLQCGHYANFVGAHWWNLQQAAFCFDADVKVEDNCVNHDVLFREGQTLLGEFTFTPRLIAFEQKLTMGTLRKEGILYSIPNVRDISWQSDVEILQNEQTPLNQFLKDLAVEDGIKLNDSNDGSTMETDVTESGKGGLDVDEQIPIRKKYDMDNSVNVWSDFLKVHYHPKTMSLVDADLSSNDENYSDSILNGRNMFKGHIMDELEDKVHYFTEECDHLQAFQFFIDTHDKFAGISTKVLEMLSDDYSSKSVMSIGFHPSVFSNDSVVAGSHRVLSSLIAYTMIHDHSTLFVPASCSSTWQNPEAAVALPYVNYQSDLNYHTSAILAGLLDTATLGLRSKVEPIHIGDLCSSLNYGSRKVAALVGALPIPLSDDVPLVDFLLSSQSLPWQSFSLLGADSVTADPQVQQIVIRGVTGSLMRQHNYHHLPRMLTHCENSSDILGLYLKESMPNTRSLVRSFNPPMNCSEPFPHIYDKKLNVNGAVCSEDRSDYVGVNSVPVLAGLQSHSQMGHHLKALVQQAKAINLKKFSNFFDEAYEVDDFNECIERMLTIIEDYHVEAASESDSDNDDA